MTFKVGDTVRVKPSGRLSNSMDNVIAGELKTIQRVLLGEPYTRPLPGGYTIYLRHSTMPSGWPIGSDDVELVAAADIFYGPEQPQETPEPEKREFQVGDIVVFTDPGCVGGTREIKSTGGGVYRFEKATGCCTFPGLHFRLATLTERGEYMLSNEPKPAHKTVAGIDAWTEVHAGLKTLETAFGPLPNLTKENINMSSTTNLINAKLSADERYARQNGLKNPDGTVTSDGVRVLSQFLWDANEKAIVKALKEADKALRAAAKADADELGNVTPE